MSLLFIESFDGADPSPGKWTGAVDHALTTTNPRTGTRALGATGNTSTGWHKTVTDTHATFIVGLAVRWNGTNRDNSANNGIVRFMGDSNATAHVTLTVDSSGVLRVRRGAGNGTVLGTSAAGAIVANTYAFIEMKVLLSDTVGTVEVRVNGVAVIGPLTSQDTKNAGTATVFDTIRLMEGSSTIDDLYLCNGTASGVTGAPNNDFLGDCKVAYLGPDTDATVEWTPSTGTDHANLVDEVPPNTTDYNASAVDGDFDMFNMEALADTTHVVYGVLVSSYGAKDDAGAREYRHRIDSGGTIATGTDKSPGVTPSYATFYDIFQEDPDNAGNAWTPTTVNDATFGVEARDV